MQSRRGDVAAALSLFLEAAVFSATTPSSRGSAPRTASDAESPSAAGRVAAAGSGTPSRSASAGRGDEACARSGSANPVVPLALVVAFSLGDLPVALSSTAGMRQPASRYRYIAGLERDRHRAALAITAGYVGFGSLGQVCRRLQAFGAGALLAMAAETMIPEAFHNSPRFSGLFAAFGFGLLLLVDATTR